MVMTSLSLSLNRLISQRSIRGLASEGTFIRGRRYHRFTFTTPLEAGSVIIRLNSNTKRYDCVVIMFEI